MVMIGMHRLLLKHKGNALKIPMLNNWQPYLNLLVSGPSLNPLHQLN
ncbi:unnamed protein product [Trichobilharzia regenti]|nr:unnamed protein product [Trichobilharzia regenti]